MKPTKQQQSIAATRKCGVLSIQYKVERLVTFARRPDIRREIARSMKNGRKKTQTGKPEVTTGRQFPAIIVEKMVISHKNAEEKCRII